jgi:hypothetical protein
MRTSASRLAALALFVGTGSLTGCTYDEDLVIETLRGKVVIPQAAAQREIQEEDGSLTVVEGVELIGPVYLGLFASAKPPGELEAYSHPEVGPQYIEDIPGDTYPYGGTTIGDLRYACFEALQCKMVSGRYVDFDGILDWFNTTISSPVTDTSDNTIETGEMFRQTCYSLMDVSTDFEVNITAVHDRNDDGSYDEQDLDFVKNADGDYEGDFTIFQQDFYEGFALWGFMDAPAAQDFSYSTCDRENGVQENEYANDFMAGRVFPNVLNQPSQYIVGGDWVVTDPYVWTDPMAEPTLLIDFAVQ